MSADALDHAPAGYAEAVEELETILREIEDDDVDVDVLATRVTRAAALIEFCRDRIVAAREAVESATEPEPRGDGDTGADHTSGSD